VHEVRKEVTAGAYYEFGVATLSGGYRYSTENDYWSNGGVGNLTLDLFSKNTTLVFSGFGVVRGARDEEAAAGGGDAAAGVLRLTGPRPSGSVRHEHPAADDAIAPLGVGKRRSAQAPPRALPIEPGCARDDRRGQWSFALVLITALGYLARLLLQAPPWALEVPVSARRVLLAIVIGLGALLGACREVIVVNGIEVYENNWRKTIDEVGTRAAFDLGCPKEQLQFSLFAKVGKHPSQVGAEGCNKRGSYTRAIIHSRIGPWQANAISELAPTPAPSSSGGAEPVAPPPSEAATPAEPAAANNTNL